MDMDEEGVDALRVIYPTVGGQILGKPFADTEPRPPCAGRTTTGASSTAAGRPERLRPAAMLPLQALDLAAEEVRRADARRAARCVCVPIPWKAAICRIPRMHGLVGAH